MQPVLRPGQRVLVLGGAGFIGSHVIPALVAAGMQVVSFDLFAPEHPLPDGVADLRGDIRDTPRLTTAMHDVDAVLNLAAAHHDFGLTSATFTSVNVGGARSVVAAMEAVGVRDLCFYSSVAVYGDQVASPDESTTPTPVNDYGRTKLAAERIYRDWQEAGQGQRRALVIRPAVVFGQRNFANMYRMIHQVARRRFLPVGPGRNRKSMVYVGNVVAAIMFLWQQQPAASPEVYNCVDKPDLSSAEIIAAVYAGLGRHRPRVHIPLAPAVWAAKPFDLIARVTGKNLPITSARIVKLSEAQTCFAADRIRAAGYIQPVPLTEGIAQMVSWYLREGSSTEPVEHLPPERPAISAEPISGTASGPAPGEGQ